MGTVLFGMARHDALDSDAEANPPQLRQASDAIEQDQAVAYAGAGELRKLE